MHLVCFIHMVIHLITSPWLKKIFCKTHVCTPIKDAKQKPKVLLHSVCLISQLSPVYSSPCLAAQEDESDGGYCSTENAVWKWGSCGEELSYEDLEKFHEVQYWYYKVHHSHSFSLAESLIPFAKPRGNQCESPLLPLPFPHTPNVTCDVVVF